MRKVRIKTKLIYGMGINDADYKTQLHIDGKRVKCKYYQKWKNMLQRCYDPKYLVREPTYTGCIVCEEWLIFSNFKKWMMLQDYEDKQLDKDILFQGNKVYSPNTCIFVSNAINSLFIKNDATRGKYNIGVCFIKHRGKFKANCSVNGKVKHLGYYLTEEEAYETYKIFKQAHIRSIANEQTDLRLREAMLNYVIE